MANEVTIVSLGHTKGDPINLVCEDSINIPKHTILAVEGERLVSGAIQVDGSQHAIGIAAAEKVASDGATTIAVYTKGLFRVTMSATDEVAAGDLVCISGANLVGELKSGLGLDTAKQILGRALEDIGSGERGVIKLGL